MRFPDKKAAKAFVHDFCGGRRADAAGFGGGNPPAARLRCADFPRPEEGVERIFRREAGGGRDGLRDGRDERHGSDPRMQAFNPRQRICF